jgi:hypothetical protein
MTTTYVWRPSSARRVVLDYEFDFSAALVGNEGDGIATVSATVTPDATGDLVVNSIAADGTVAVLWLSAGQAGSIYTVRVSVTTQSGRSLGRAVLLAVQTLGSAVVASSALTTDQGTVVTDQNGNPILIGS